ncbi:Protein kinase domain-containing protein [Mycena venus]|uniref:Protein kinase domain-containing protein n=1 Tax=Mycena venus TaxID=2733690 RepID=A0A8H7CMM8_9AGAR|nr:Protein kinase domain-containing protein [Mycena venus]
MSRPAPVPQGSPHASRLRDTQGRATAPKPSSALASQVEAEDSTIDAMESYYSQVKEWKDQLDNFFAENASTINSAENVLSSVLDVENIEEKFTALAQTSKTIIAGLDILGQIHPFISLAVQAFKLAINVDATRRENDKKVLAVQLQMQDMIVVLFHLRGMPDPKKKVEGQTVEDRMSGLVQSIAKHVTSCRSACEGYKKKGFIPKMIKCKTYEDRLATYAQLFADDKREIQFTLQLYTTYGVKEINQKIDQQGTLIERTGGTQNCVNNDEVLRELFAMGGESLATRHEVHNARKLLRKELAEDVDEVLAKHIRSLSRQLEKQNDRVLHAMTSNKEEILAAFRTGLHNKISDPELQGIWREQRWPGSINGQDFVSALNEYYEEKLAKSDDSAGEAAIRSFHDSERWTLGFINTANSKLIIEAVDDDGSGSVSIREVNNFTARKPNGWSLPKWIAFWAVGWYPTVAWYKKEIERILSESTSFCQFVHPANLQAANSYFAGAAIRRVALLLRSTHSPSKKTHVEPRLKLLTDEFRMLEEELLKTRLEERSYFLDQLATVQQVIDRRRIDCYIFPLLYLLLNHHLDTMRRAGRGPLNDSEFTSMSTSLDTVFKAAESRLDELEAMFQNSVDVKERLGYFAFGMFQLLYDHFSAKDTKAEHEGADIDSAHWQDTADAVTAFPVGSADTAAFTPVNFPEFRQETFEPAYERLHTFLVDNASTISNAVDALTAVTNSDVNSIASKTTKIVELSNVLIRGLDKLVELHPFVKDAVFSFKEAIALVIQCHEQDNKVLAVTVQMQDMMIALFQLRHVHDSVILKDRLGPAIVSIAEDIISCSNECDLYMKKWTMAKMFINIFEEPFANYVTRFSEHKHKLMAAMSLRAAHTVMSIEIFQSHFLGPDVPKRDHAM